MDVARAVRGARAGTAIDLEVAPGARDASFPAGFNPWRNRVEIRVRAPPEDGAANDEVVQAVAAFFGLPPTRVAIVAGPSSRRKTVLVEGVAPQEVAALLARSLRGNQPNV